jgi:hypothetical protein
LADDDRAIPAAAGKSFLIAIPEFAASDVRSADIAVRIRQVIINRLSHLDAYALSDAIVGATDINRPPEFSAWQARNVQVLIIAQVNGGNDGKLKVEARAWNIPDRQQIAGQQVVAPVDNWQQVADLLAEEIGQHLTGHVAASQGELPKRD